MGCCIRIWATQRILFLARRSMESFKITVFRLLPILIKYNFFSQEFQLLPTPCLLLIVLQFFHTLIYICYCTSHGLSQKRIPGLWSCCPRPAATWNMPLLFFLDQIYCSSVPRFLICSAEALSRSFAEDDI